MNPKNIISLLIALLIGYLLYLVMVPFFIPIFWAVVFVILFYPYYRWLLKRVTGNTTLASAAACVSISIFLIVPLAVIGVVMANELFTLYRWIDNYVGDISARAHRSPLFIFPLLEKYFGRFIDLSAVDLRNIFIGSLKEMAGFAAEGLKGFVKNFAQFVFNLILAFFAMYYLFKDGDRLLAIFKNLLPLSDGDKEKLVNKTRLVIYATINGGLAVGACQGILGGLSFWVLGLSSPILWGSVMFLLSFLPGIGTAFVWVPATIYLLATGGYIKALIMFIWSALIVSLIDNFLRPFIVSGKTNLHPLLIFFSILGAISVFGLVGIVAGPLLISIGQAIVELYLDSINNKKNATE